jgi:hypothetical protein
MYRGKGLVEECRATGVVLGYNWYKGTKGVHE